MGIIPPTVIDLLDKINVIITIEIIYFLILINNFISSLNSSTKGILY